MKFNAYSTEFSKKLGLASLAISPKSINPIYEDFLLTLEKDTLTINATNIEISISLTLEVKGQEDGSIAISSKILLETLRSLPDQPITFEVLENNLVQITSSFGQYKMAYDDPDFYPTFDAFPEGQSFEMEGKQLKKAIEKNIIAVGESGVVRPSMTGVNFHFNHDKVDVVSTDSHILVKYSIGGQSFDGNLVMTIPPKGLNLLKNSLIDDCKVNITSTGKKAFFKFEDFEIICTLITEEFPNYNSVIPVSHENVLYINRRDLLNSLKRLMLFSNKNLTLVTFNITEDSLTLASEDLEFSHDATEQLPCRYEGEPLTLGFSSKFFIELLSIVDGDEVKIEITNPKIAVLLKPVENIDLENLLLLIMPLIVK